MNLNIGLDISSCEIEQLKLLNNEGTIPTYFELPTRMSKCTVLDNQGNTIYNNRWTIMNSIKVIKILI